MSRSPLAVPRQPDGYHHGDLRRALLAAAFQVLAEHGLDGLTLREVARRAGVSHAAPYHHFADKAALLAALVEAGFADLTLALQAAFASPGPNLDRFARVGVAYVRFAMDHPATFRLLFRPELRTAAERLAPAEVGETGRAAYGVLFEAVHACLATGEVAGDAESLALTAWCVVHGLATLLLDGPLRDQLDPIAQAEALARRVTAVLAIGLIRRGD
jgi:AcrR family transcriptional regulator